MSIGARPWPEFLLPGRGREVKPGENKLEDDAPASLDAGASPF
jgi:hypothetical protein